MVEISTPLLHFFKTQAKKSPNASKNKAKTFEIITSVSNFAKLDILLNLSKLALVCGVSRQTEVITRTRHIEQNQYSSEENKTESKSASAEFPWRSDEVR